MLVGNGRRGILPVAVNGSKYDWPQVRAFPDVGPASGCYSGSEPSCILCHRTAVMQGETVMVGKCRENRPCRGVVTVIALLCSLVLSFPAGAVVVENLYKATVPVSGQDEAQLAEAYQAGLERVLVRVSGDRDVTRREGMETHLEDAESLLASSQSGPGSVCSSR